MEICCVSVPPPSRISYYANFHFIKSPSFISSQLISYSFNTGSSWAYTNTLIYIDEIYDTIIDIKKRTLLRKLLNMYSTDNFIMERDYRGEHILFILLLYDLNFNVLTFHQRDCC